MWRSSGYLALIATFGAGVEYFVGWDRVLEPWTQAAPSALVVAATLVFACYLLRAARIYRLFAECRSYPACVRLFLFHNAFVNFLPLHSGEASFPVLMKRYFATPIGSSVAALVWLRALDLHALLLAGLVAFWFAGPWKWAGWLIPFWLSLPLVAVWGWCRWDNAPKSDDRPLVARAKGTLNSLPQRRALLLETCGWTFANWLTKIATFGWILTIFAPLEFFDSMLGATGGELSNVLPLKTPAGVGTYEAGIVAGIAALGSSVANALTAAINLHVFTAGLALFGGVVAFLLPRSNRVAAPVS